MKPTTRLFVANLPENLKDEELVSAFSVFGKVTSLDLNVKTEAGKECTKFAFVSLTAPKVDVESCIQHFTTEDFKGVRLYVSIARESFLEKLQREKNESENKDDKFMCQESLHQNNRARRNCDKINFDKLNRSVKWSWRTNQDCHFMHQQNIANVIPINLIEKLNPRKRKIEQYHATETALKTRKHKEGVVLIKGTRIKNNDGANKIKNTRFVNADRNKLDAKKKLFEAMKKRRQNLKEKQAIPTILMTDDEVQNKRGKLPNFDDIQKLKENHKKVSKQVTIHWIRVYQNARVLHRHKQDLMHTHKSMASMLKG